LDAAAVCPVVPPAVFVEVDFGLLLAAGFSSLFMLTVIVATRATATTIRMPMIRFLFLICSGDGPVIRALDEIFFLDISLLLSRFECMYCIMQQPFRSFCCLISSTRQVAGINHALCC
jgi:hypothetical protein